MVVDEREYHKGVNIKKFIIYLIKKKKTCYLILYKYIILLNI